MRRSVPAYAISFAFAPTIQLLPTRSMNKLGFTVTLGASRIFLMIFRHLAATSLLAGLAFAATGALSHAVAAGRPADPVALVQGSQLGKSMFTDGDTARGGQGAVVDGIEGSSHEMLKSHIHVHLSIYYKGQQIAVPRGIGILPPLKINHGFVEGGKGYYWLHTHDASGIIHVESPDDRVYTLGNLFDVWGQPLTESNVAGLRGVTRIYLNGQMQFGKARDLPLKAHDQITLVVGAPAVAPTHYLFPDGL
jgi:hypothetical protein